MTQAELTSEPIRDLLRTIVHRKSPAFLQMPGFGDNPATRQLPVNYFAAA